MIVLSTNPSPALPFKCKSVFYTTYMAYYRRFTHPSIYEGREMNFAIAKEKGWVISAALPFKMNELRIIKVNSLNIVRPQHEPISSSSLIMEESIVCHLHGQ